MRSRRWRFDAPRFPRRGRRRNGRMAQKINPTGVSVPVWLCCRHKNYNKPKSVTVCFLWRSPLVRIQIMRVSKEELAAVLSRFNTWWRDEPIADLPQSRRAAFRELHTWTTAPPAPRAVLRSGAREIGKTTLLQGVDALLRAGIPPANILIRDVRPPDPETRGYRRGVGRMARARAQGGRLGVPVPRRGSVHPRLGHLGKASGGFPQGAPHRLGRFGHATGGGGSGIGDRTVAHHPSDDPAVP